MYADAKNNEAMKQATSVHGGAKNTTMRKKDEAAKEPMNNKKVTTINYKHKDNVQNQLNKLNNTSVLNSKINKKFRTTTRYIEFKATIMSCLT